MSTTTHHALDFWSAEIVATSGGSAVVRSWDDLSALVTVAEPPLPVGLATPAVPPTAAAYYARLDAAFARTAAEPEGDDGGLPGEITPI
jgi:hypothetical protein